MNNIYLDAGFAADLVDAAIADAAMLDGCELRLYTNVIDWSVPHVTADFTAPTFTTYALDTPTPVPGVDSEGNVCAIAPPSTFSPSNGTNLPQVIRGAIVTNAAHNFLFGGDFAVPITLTAALQQIHCTLKLPIGGDAPGSIEASMA